MYQLGDTVFEGLKGFSSLSSTKEGEYAEHALVGTKPRAQRTGDKLETLELTVRLHSAFCTPEVELDRLERSRRVGYILGLVAGDGRYYGDYIIHRLTYDVEKQGPDGGMWAVRVSLSLSEYYYDDRPAAARRQARAVAFAVPGNARPFTQPPVVSANPAALLSARIGFITSAASAVANVLRLATSDTNRRAFYMREIARNSARLGGAVAGTVASATGNTDGQTEIAAALGTGALAGAAVDLAAFAAAGDFANVQLAAGELANQTDLLRAASQRAAVATAVGKTDNGSE